MPATRNPHSLNPKVLAKLGEDIYRLKFQEEYEREHHGKFVAINVQTSAATLGDTAEEALEKARAADPDDLFHLIRVGFPSAFQMGTYQNASNSDWLFR
ncbi:MAG: hypothetical protein HY235_02465 [Acidobacteria bacterium]|nr:hypothetical protein [Acidobacteriota bacterium]